MKDILNKFHSKSHYERYLYMCKFAKKINEYLDLGYLIFNDKGNILDKDDRFIFEDRYNKEPTLGIIKEKCTFLYACDVSSEKGYYIELNKKEIKEKFNNFKIVNPKDIKKIKL